MVRGLVKFANALAKLAGTNFTKPRTKTFADLCMEAHNQFSLHSELAFFSSILHPLLNYILPSSECIGVRLLELWQNIPTSMSGCDLHLHGPLKRDLQRCPLFSVVWLCDSCASSCTVAWRVNWMRLIHNTYRYQQKLPHPTTNHFNR